MESKLIIRPIMKAYFVEVFDLVDICLRNKILSEAKKELKRVFFFFFKSSHCFILRDKWFKVVKYKQRGRKIYIG